MSETHVDAPPKARAVVVTVHGLDGSKDWGFFPWLSEYLCESGIVAVRFTMSHNGAYTVQIQELLNVVAYARAHFRGLPLFLLGHSRGGGVALLAAREIETLAGVITWSAIARADHWGDADVSGTAVLADFEANRERLDILDSASRLQVPLLAIHGANDTSVPPEESREIVSRARDASLLLIGGASHTFNTIHPLVHVSPALEFAALVSAHFAAAYS